LLTPLVDGCVDLLVILKLAAGFHSVADRPAEVGGIGVGEGGDRDAPLGASGCQGVSAAHVEVGNPADDLILVTADKVGGAVLSLHGERSRDLAEMVALPFLGIQLSVGIGEVGAVDFSPASPSGKAVHGFEIRLSAPEQTSNGP
jgi:hypothetical protein